MSNKHLHICESQFIVIYPNCLHFKFYKMLVLAANCKRVYGNILCTWTSSLDLIIPRLTNELCACGFADVANGDQPRKFSVLCLCGKRKGREQTESDLFFILFCKDECFQAHWGSFPCSRYPPSALEDMEIKVMCR